ncbi:ankyrin repeat-containing domain protein [Lipomyces kononenkoae]|uniref:Ankyrin repeat-containing domain protein n=1 Tax=Lipomyces kononenkoae TaxID=34357 RepID=A0ACC3SRY3_LIPKO
MPRQLTEEQIDDLIYSARVDDLHTLKSIVERLSKDLSQSETDILLQAIDPYSKSTPLHMSCANGHLEIVEYILSKFPSSPSATNPSIVTLQNDSGNTPLHWACLNGHQKIIERLCDSGADPFVKNLAGQDCFFQAENNEKLDVVDYLLQRFQDVLDEDGDAKAEEEEADNREHESKPETGAMGEKLESLDINENGI